MKLSWILIVVSIIGLFLGFFVLKDFNNFLGYSSLFISVVTLILGVLWRKEDLKTASLKLEEDRLHTYQIIEKVENAEDKIIGELKQKDKNIIQ